MCVSVCHVVGGERQGMTCVRVCHVVGGERQGNLTGGSGG